ncbi:MAG: protein translocase subunit SecD [Acidobacteriota bacterium]|jgi:preprotein translocase subunit SecD
MAQNLKMKVLAIVAVTLACIYGIVGIPTSVDSIKENFQKNIHLGLDLKGGSQLVMQIQVQDAFKTEADTVIQRLRQDLNDKRIKFTDIIRNDPQTIQDASSIAITISGVDPLQSGDLRQLANDTYGAVWNLAAAGADYRMTMKQTEALALIRDTRTQTMNTIEKKINGLGLAESSVQQRGGTNSETEILVQLPGVEDPAHIKQVLKTAAKLELIEVQGGPFGSREDALASKNGVLGFGSQIKSSGRGSGEFYILSRTPVVTGRDLRNSQAQASATNRQMWETTFVLTQDAAKRFESYTGANIGKQMAIVLDDQVLMAPTIEAKISDSGVINNIGDQQAASDLALNLRAGSLPAGLSYLEERSVGPSLGADSIRSGMVAGLAGLIAVVVVMLIYYKGAGVNAVVALILNAVILIAALAYFGAVLTLPGIAGIILTIGMAVDSNVLIFERIREELRAGKGVLTSVDQGFSKALLTIIDTHLTTVVSCAFLFLFGTTQVKGFAVTLVIGLIANLFTAIFVSRVMFDWSLSGSKRPETISI